MRILIAFFKFIRWPNLLILFFTQLMLNYFIIDYIFELIQMKGPISFFEFFLLSLSTLFMAAFGYIINDLKDVNVDALNHSNKVLVNKTISLQKAYILAIIFILLSLLSAFYLSIRLQMIQLVFVHLLIAVGLYYYSSKLKSSILTGNILISLFAATSVFIVWLYHLAALAMDPVKIIDAQKVVTFTTYIVIAYSIFAFLTNFLREIIKDVEDRQGDEKTGLKTFVIKYGLPASKKLIFAIGFIILIFLATAIYFTYSYKWYQLSIYLGIAVGIPILYLLKELRKAEKKDDFKQLSLLTKIIMIAGVLSMQLFYISYGHQ
jgi:4-hydroxybenzoate polyprenyltransferase